MVQRKRHRRQDLVAVAGAVRGPDQLDQLDDGVGELLAIGGRPPAVRVETGLAMPMG
jgi:hypothetical protein